MKHDLDWLCFQLCSPAVFVAILVLRTHPLFMGPKKKQIICGRGQSMALAGQEESSQDLISDLSEHSQSFPGPSAIHRLPVFI